MSKKSYISLIFSNSVVFKTLSSNHRMNNFMQSCNVPRRGPVPKFSDLEVMTLSLTAET